MNLFRICCFLLVATVLLASACNLKPERSLVLATTTSTYDSGLLDAIIPLFEEENNVKVRVIVVGTGQALALGARGDADVLLVHAPQKEEQFVADGFGVDRTYVMYNDFVVLGPSDDPADIKGLGSVAEAFSRIAETGSTFASRGDESGTHTKEKLLWVQAGIDSPEDEDWYMSLGQGMGGTLTTASEMKAYTLSDRGTYLSRAKLDLVVLTEGDELLFNPYHVIIVNPEKFPNVQAEMARLLVNFLLSEETRQAIYQFGRDRYGQGLFTPIDVSSTGE